MFKRTIVSRSPEKVAEDLDKYTAEGIRRVYCCHDFINVLGENYTRRVFNKRRKLSIDYEFLELPTIEGFEMLMDSFESVDIFINLVPPMEAEKSMFPSSN